jgi:hypothetical protein
MSFEWSAFLDVAQDVGRRREPAYLRTAISRAYYAVLGQARLRLRDDGRILRGIDSHQQVWEAFESAPDRQRREIGRLGMRLRRLRVEADYHETMTGLPLKSDRALGEAQRGFGLLATLD